jgi:SSS family solute:Na+ symporter
MSGIDTVAFTVVAVIFAVVTLIGFAAARWRRAEDKLHLNGNLGPAPARARAVPSP